MNCSGAVSGSNEFLNPANFPALVQLQEESVVIRNPAPFAQVAIDAGFVRVRAGHGLLTFLTHSIDLVNSAICHGS